MGRLAAPAILPRAGVGAAAFRTPRWRTRGERVCAASLKQPVAARMECGSALCILFYHIWVRMNGSLACTCGRCAPAQRVTAQSAEGAGSACVRAPFVVCVLFVKLSQSDVTAPRRAPPPQHAWRAACGQRGGARRAAFRLLPHLLSCCSSQRASRAALPRATPTPRLSASASTCASARSSRRRTTWLPPPSLRRRRTTSGTHVACVTLASRLMAHH